MCILLSLLLDGISEGSQRVNVPCFMYLVSFYSCEQSIGRPVKALSERLYIHNSLIQERS